MPAAAHSYVPLGDAAEAGEAPLTEEQLLQRLDSFDELMPRSLESVCEDIRANGSVALPAQSDERAARIALLKMLDVDLSGGISSEDLVASVLHRKRSAWQAGRGMRFAGMVVRSAGRERRTDPAVPKT